VFAEDEERPVTHSFESQSTYEPVPEAVTGRRCRGEVPHRGLVSAGDRRPRPGRVDPALTDPGRCDGRRPDNNVHRRVDTQTTRQFL